MLQKIKPQSARDDFKVRCDAILAEVERVQSGGTDKNPRAAVMLVGRITLPSPKLSFDQIVTDVFVDSQGHFVAGVQPGRPVGFRLHGFLPVDYTPKGSMDGVEYAGDLAFKKTPPNQSATVTTRIRLEGPQPQGKLHISASVLEDNTNRIKPASGSGADKQVAIEPQVEYRGDGFRIFGLSPIRYRLSIFCHPFRQETVTVTLQPKQSLDLGTVVLHEDPSPQIKAGKAVRFHHIASASGTFAGLAPVMETPGSTWFYIGPNKEHYMKCRVDEEEELFLQPNNPPQMLLDLGPGKLTDFQHIDARRLPEGMEVARDRHLAKNHVYLLYHRSYRHSWLLFHALAVSAP